MTLPSEPTPPRSRPDLLATSRLAVLTSFGTIAGAIPLPYVPGSLNRWLRGALIHDIATRHGLSLTSDAREALAASSSSKTASIRWLSGAASFVTRRLLRRVGPLALLPPARSGLEMFALGVLFERYVTTVRHHPSVRIHVAEARGLREAIDRSVIRAFHPKLTPSTLPKGDGTSAEDLRDDFTRFLDLIMLTGANIPGYLVRRLEGAFDAVLAERPELVDG